MNRIPWWTLPVQAWMYEGPPVPKAMGVLGKIHEAIDPVRAFGGYGGLLSMATMPEGNWLNPRWPKETWYRGTTANEFPLKNPNDPATPAFYVTDNPELASNFAEGLPTISGKVEPGGRVMPLQVKSANIFDYNNPKHLAVGDRIIDNLYTGRSADVLKGSLRDGGWEALEQIAPALKRHGFTGYYTFEDIFTDAPGPDLAGRGIGLFYPETDVRSAIGVR